MNHRRPLFVFLWAVALAVPGCQNQDKSVTATALSEEREFTSTERAFAYMSDNAMLHDMSVADIHFVPHTSELNGTGIARLNRLSKLLDVYGGTVRYESMSRDEDMIAARIAHVEEYIAFTGCDMDRVEVKSMRSGGRGISAQEAIRIAEEGTTNDMETTGGTGEEGGDAAALPTGG